VALCEAQGQLYLYDLGTRIERFNNFCAAFDAKEPSSVRVLHGATFYSAVESETTVNITTGGHLSFTDRPQTSDKSTPDRSVL
jgi:hypothetical protein